MKNWLILLGLILFVCPPLQAAEVNLTCTEPTQNEDGSALTDLDGIRFYESQVSGGPYTLIGDSPNCSWVIERDPGTYYYVATAYNTQGVESVYSAEASKTVEPAVPNPPTGLTADAGTIAYTLQQITDGLVMYPTAIVRDVAFCDPHIKITTANHPAGLSLIPKSSVDFPPGVQARTLYAECSSGS